MDNEAGYQQDRTQTPATKQTFIYKKNPTNAAKAITRKMRHQAPTALEQQNSVTISNVDSSTMPNQHALDATISQNEAETIATQGQMSHVSPRAEGNSSGNFRRLDYEMMNSSDATRRPQPENRRFHGQRANTSAANKHSAHYEDNIDSETEVFIDPTFETNLEQARQTADEAHMRQHARDLYSSTGNPAKPKKSKPAPLMSQEDHFRAIDAVINSNADDQAKQSMIAEIQDRYRKGQRDGRADPKKPRTQKKFKDAEDGFAENPDGRPRKKKTNVIDIAELSNPELKQALTAKPKARREKAGKGKKDAQQANHNALLMPEMNEFMGEKPNYLTQDEMGDSRLAQLGLNKKGKPADSEDDDRPNSKLQYFTPGRIRPGLKPKDQTGYLKSPQANTISDFQDPGGKRARTKNQHPRKRSESIGQQESLQSVGAPDYNQLLPAVKLQAKKKKHYSPSTQSGGAIQSTSAMAGLRDHSTSRISHAGGREHKLRPTLDQSLHFVPASIKVPTKQTLFYDDKHASAITQQQLQTWKAKDGRVLLDKFHAGKKSTIPVNRHRIPAVGAEPEQEEKVKLRPPGGGSFMWDMDGRRHVKPKGSKGRVITSNATLHKVDLPRINPSHPDVLSPANNSQPPSINRLPNSKSIPGPPPNKEKKLRLKYPPTSELNTQSNNTISPVNPKLDKLQAENDRLKRENKRLKKVADRQNEPLVDIQLKPSIDPSEPIYEPPIDNESQPQPQQIPAQEPPLEPSKHREEDPEEPKTPYQEELEKNRKKAQKRSLGRVLVEDDFISDKGDSDSPTSPKRGKDRAKSVRSSNNLKGNRKPPSGNHPATQGPLSQHNRDNSLTPHSPDRNNHASISTFKPQENQPSEAKSPSQIPRPNERPNSRPSDGQQSSIVNPDLPLSERNLKSPATSQEDKPQETFRPSSSFNQEDQRPGTQPLSHGQPTQHDVGRGPSQLSMSAAPTTPLPPGLAAEPGLSQPEFAGYPPETEEPIQAPETPQAFAAPSGRSGVSKPPKSPAASVGMRVQSPFTNNNGSLGNPRSMVDGSNDRPDDYGPRASTPEKPRSILKDGTPKRELNSGDGPRQETNTSALQVPMPGSHSGEHELRQKSDDVGSPFIKSQGGLPSAERHMNSPSSKNRTEPGRNAEVSSEQPGAQPPHMRGSERSRDKPPQTATAGERDGSVGKSPYDAASSQAPGADRGISPDLSLRNPKHLLSATDVPVAASIQPAGEKSPISRRTGGDVKLNKVKSQNATSQVRFAHEANERLVDSRMYAQENQVMSSHVLQEQGHVSKTLEHNEYVETQHRVTYQSQKSHHKTQQDERLHVERQISVPTEHVARRGNSQMKIHQQSEDHQTAFNFQDTRSQHTNKKIRSSAKSSATVAKSRESGLIKKRLARGISKDAESRGRRNSSHSRSSQSPPVVRVIETLTNHKVRVDQETKLLINGTELLSNKGIQGKIHKVGVGFGTGRHTSHRPRKATDKKSEPEIKPKISRTVSTQHVQPEKHSVGVNPNVASTHSMQVSAHVQGQDIALSARSPAPEVERASVAISAKPMSEVSVREQGDQVSEGRFDPRIQDAQVETGRELLDDFFHRPSRDCGTSTVPVIFGEAKPVMMTAQIQTDPLIDEVDGLAEPSHQGLAQAQEAKLNSNRGSAASLLAVPETEQILEIVVPPEPEPEEKEVHIIDWASTPLFEYVKAEHHDRMVKKKLTTQEERPDTPASQKGMSKQQRFDYNLNPENLEILSYMECDYGQSAIRHKSATYLNDTMLDDLFERAKVTVKLLADNMVRPDVCTKTLLEHYLTPSKTNVTKLLLRCKRLYDARNEAVTILKVVMEVEAAIQPKSDVWRIMQDNNKQKLKPAFSKVLNRTLQVLSHALTRITIFREEQRVFKEDFKFRDRVYREYITDIGKIIGGFLKLKREANPALQETGLLLEDHDEHDEQAERYQQWVQASVDEFGRLDMPAEDDVDQTLQTERQPSKQKGSRIEKAVERLREEMREKSDHESAQMSRLNSDKSGLLAEMRKKNKQGGQLHNSSQDPFRNTGISEQMLDRIEESARKRDRVARANEERQKRHEDGYQTPDEYEDKKRMPGTALLVQQLQYDNEMEDQATQHGKPMTLGELQSKEEDAQVRDELLAARRSASQENLVCVRDEQSVDSIVSAQTRPNAGHRKPVVRGRFEDYKEFNVGRYDFAPSGEPSVHRIGEAYEKPRIHIPNLKGLPNSEARHATSVQPINGGTDSMRYAVRPFDRQSDNLELFQGGMRSSPSAAAVTNVAAVEARGPGPLEPIAMEEATEFTEPGEEDPQAFALESDLSALHVSLAEEPEVAD